MLDILCAKTIFGLKDSFFKKIDIKQKQTDSSQELLKPVVANVIERLFICSIQHKCSPKNLWSTLLISGKTTFPKFPTPSCLPHKELSTTAVKDGLEDSTGQMNKIRHWNEEWVNLKYHEKNQGFA